MALIATIFTIVGPYVTGGSDGNAIYTPNSGTLDDNFINLGSHQDDCLGRMFDCPGGATFSLWFKAPQQVAGWPTMCSGTSFGIYNKWASNKLDLRVRMKNSTHTHSANLGLVSLNEWHLIGITYSQSAGYEVYYDGCSSKTYITTFAAPSHKDFQLGCFNQANCIKMYFDDLRVWNARKSPQFMWLLWKA